MPNSVELLKKHGWNVRVEHDAGTGAKFRDRDYEIAGAEIVSKESVFHSGLFRKHNFLSVVELVFLKYSLYRINILYESSSPVITLYDYFLIFSIPIPFDCHSYYYSVPIILIY